MDAAPGVLTADTQTIPAYDPQITLPPRPHTRKLSRVRVNSITSDDVEDRDRRGGGRIKRGLRVRIQGAGVEVT